MNEIPLLRLSDVRAIRERTSFLLVQTDNVIIQEDRVFIEIEDNPLVAADKSSRHVFEIEEKVAWRWPAGGTSIILELKDGRQILLAPRRTLNAPTLPYHDGLGGGLGGSEKEILYPLRVSLREGVEEVIISTPSGVVCPSLELDHFGFDLELESIVRTGTMLFSQLKDLLIKPEKAELIDLPGSKDVHVRWRGRETKCRALVCIDKELRGIEILMAVLIKLDCSLDELSIFDGEVFSDNKPANRRVNAYELKNLRPTGRIVAAWLEGLPYYVSAEERSKDASRKLTPALNDILVALGKIR